MFKKRYYALFPVIMFWLMVSGCSANDQRTGQETEGDSVAEVELTVSAAASLQDVLTEIAASFEKENPNVKITYNFGASGALQQQISQGAPVDLFFSAAEDKFDQLVKEGFIQKNQGTNLLGNEMVLIVPKHADSGINGFDDLTKAAAIAIGTPEAVPAGTYAKETLEHVKVWEEVEGSIVYAKDVRQVLAYVETNNVDAGIVYKTDAQRSSNVTVVATADKTMHAPILYPAGVVTNSPHLKEATLFYEYLQSEAAKTVFEKYGFTGM